MHFFPTELRVELAVFHLSAFQGSFCTPVPHTASPKQCELYAVREGLDLLRALQIHNATVDSDCTEAQTSDHTLLANGGLIHDIQLLNERPPTTAA
ncbi:hypothetical protein ACLB2K_004383 [Fragaria x ananassa]